MNDVNNELKIKNQLENRQDWLIFLGYKNNINLIKEIKEFFINITFKIIPKENHPYKLIVLYLKFINLRIYFLY